MKKINYFFNFINSYRNIVIQVFFFEIFYSIKFVEFIPLIKIHNDKKRTDTVPCIFYFLYKISKFIKKNKIKSFVDVGSGYGRTTNFLSTLNKIKSHGIELDNEVYKDALKIKKKGVRLHCDDIFNFKLNRFNSNCFILNDPFKDIKDTNKFLLRYTKIFPNKDKYLITVNIYKAKLPKNIKLIYSKFASKTRCLKFYKIHSK